MERGLLWAAAVMGVAVFLARFASPRRGDPLADALPEPGPKGWNFPLIGAAFLAPLLYLLTLPTHGAFFHPGGMLGVGYLLGGIGAFLVLATTLRRYGTAVLVAPTTSVIGVAGAVGLAAALAAGGQLFLRASLVDALLGVAIGWFCVTLAWYLALPADARGDETARQLAAGAGAAAALCAASVFGTLRDGITPEIAKGTWGGALTLFAAFGALLIAGARFLPLFSQSGAGKGARSLPYLILLLGAGAGLYLLAQKYALDSKFAYAGIGGMLVSGVGCWALRADKGKNIAPVVTFMLIVGGFTASAQMLQGVGASAFVLALWLGYAALKEDSDFAARSAAKPELMLLPLFATSLLLFRLFTTRWENDLRGVGLTDSYALFGFLVGGFLPSLLTATSVVSAQWSVVGRRGWAGVAGLAVTAALTVAVPAAVILLFGAKAASALMVGLAVGRVIMSPRGGILPALLAIGVGLAMTQFFGHLLPPEEWTRAEKIKALGVIIAVLLAAPVLSLMAASLLSDKTGGAGHKLDDKEGA